MVAIAHIKTSKFIITKKEKIPKVRMLIAPDTTSL
jgi:hypothetical protein